jgi:hypothetical protein
LVANDITRSLERIALYLERGDRCQALADLGEISRRLWNRLQGENRKP